MSNFLNTTIIIEGEEISQHYTNVDGLSWIDFLEVFLRQSLPAAGYRVDPSRVDEIMDFIEIQKDELLKETFFK